MCLIGTNPDGLFKRGGLWTSGDGYSSLGEPPDPEIDPDYGSSEGMQCASELQRGYSGHLEVYDGLETKLGCIQGTSEGDGVELSQFIKMNVLL